MAEYELAQSGRLDDEGGVLRYSSGNIITDTPAVVVVAGGALLKSEAPIWLYYDATTNTWPSAAAYAASQRIVWVGTEAAAVAPTVGRPGREPNDVVMLLP
jgi:hypothetical protein